MSLVLTFRCDGALYAVPAGTVVEIVELPALSPWPRAPRGVAGVVDYRGSLVPVIDVAARVGGGPATPLQEQDQLIVLTLSPLAQNPPRKAALLVQEALELKALPPWRALPDDPSLRHASPYLLGTVTDGEQVVLGLDLEALTEVSDLSPSAGLTRSSDGSEVLARRARELAAPLSAPVEGAHREVLVVRLGGEKLGIPVEEVVELGACPAFTPVPAGPAHLLGLIYLRGSLMRLVDVRAMLGLDQGGPLPREMVVLAGGGMPTGLAVDAIVGVASVKGSGATVAFEDGWLTLLDTRRLDIREPRPEVAL